MAVRFPHSSPDVYQPLEEGQIRTLAVSRGQLHDPVQCVLRTITLLEETVMPYESISYCWGDATKRSQMIIDGHHADVTFSSEQAIRRMRLPEADRTLWIDAICINQDDLKEKTSQVASMGMIYRKATGNLIHLGGQEDDDTPRVEATLDAVTRRIEREVGILSPNEQMACRRGLWSHALTRKALLSNDDMRNLYRLYRAPWFQRVWVVQEMTLAKLNTCYLGKSKFRLDRVLMIGWVYISTIDTIPALPDEYYSDDSQGYRGLVATGFMHLVDLLFGLSAMPSIICVQLIPKLMTSEPRDRIFGVLELLRKPGGGTRSDELLKADYSKPVTDVFRDATRYLLEQHHDGQDYLDRISHRSVAELYQHGKTSWTFAWDRELTGEDCNTIRAAGQFAGLPAKQSSETLLRVLSSTDPNVLSLEGFTIGGITTLGYQVTRSLLEDQSATRVFLEKVLDLCHAKCRTTPGTLLRRFCGHIPTAAWRCLPKISDSCAADPRTMAADILTAGDSVVPYWGTIRVEEKSRALMILVRKLRRSSSLPPRSIQDDCSHEMRLVSVFFNNVRDALRHRRLCALETGHIGVGPKITQEGDMVVVCRGSQLPYVLRPVADGRYRFIGAAYIHGIMHGEVFKMNRKLTRFDIV